MFPATGHSSYEKKLSIMGTVLAVLGAALLQIADTNTWTVHLTPAQYHIVQCCTRARATYIVLFGANGQWNKSMLRAYMINTVPK